MSTKVPLASESAGKAADIGRKNLYTSHTLLLQNIRF